MIIPAAQESQPVPGERRAIPIPPPLRTRAGHGQQTLVDLMYDGFYALFLLQQGAGPHSADGLAEHMTQFLGEVERNARQRDIAPDDVCSAKYAFCAAVDEIMLRSQFAVREAWERRPLQLRLFGDQLAGEHFFDRLEHLRTRGASHLQALEVFHMCLLLGFQGRYAIEGVEKLNYMTARLGEEIALMRGTQRGFAPHAERPDHISHKLGSGATFWILTLVFAVAGVGAFAAFRAQLDSSVDTALAGSGAVVAMPPPPATVTIHLP